METYANGIVEDEMISSLSFKIDPTANYVTDRKSVTYQAQGSNIYQSGAGNSVIKFTISGTGQYLDPSTVRFVYTLKNNGGANRILYPLSGPWCFFRRCRIYSGAGSVIEDIDYANRVHEMFSLLTSGHVRSNDVSCEGFGDCWDSDEVYESNYGTADIAHQPKFRDRYQGQIASGNSRTVSFKPLFGILNQPKFIPLQWLPLTMEFELVSNATDPVADFTDGGDAVSQFQAGNTSTEWEISNCMIKADVVELDSAVHNEYANHLMQGNPIPINYTSFITQLQVASGADIAINITRSCSRLKTVFITLGGTYESDDVIDRTRNCIRKDWNTFFHPMRYTATKRHEDEVQLQMLVGNKTFPVFPIRSASEAFAQLKKALGVHGSGFHSFSIDTARKYCHDHFIVGLDTEKVLGASFSGINCRQDLITISIKAANGTFSTAGTAANPPTAPNRVWVTLQADYVVEIRESGSLVID